MSELIPFAVFQQRLEGIEKQLTYVGDVERDDAGDRAIRQVAFAVSAPGYGLPVEVRLGYRERYRRVSDGWLRDGYAFEFRRLSPAERLAHHDHGKWGIHQHCEPRGRPSGAHYADHERLLQATHDDFVRLYTMGTRIDCTGLRPLRARPSAAHEGAEAEALTRRSIRPRRAHGSMMR